MEGERRSTRWRRRVEGAPEEEAGIGKKGGGRTKGGGATGTKHGHRKAEGEWRRSRIFGWWEKGRRF